MPSGLCFVTAASWAVGDVHALPSIRVLRRTPRERPGWWSRTANTALIGAVAIAPAMNPFAPDRRSLRVALVIPTVL